MNDLTIPKTLIKRAEMIAARSHRKPSAILANAIRKGLDYEEWLIAEVDKGLSELDSGEVVSHEELRQSLEAARVERAKNRKKMA
ncbi:MAG: CopG family ribbon-helix-helix protein [Sulfuricella sp.]|nr:hypothetical protein [Gammaproteobacteria bacterium]